MSVSQKLLNILPNNQVKNKLIDRVSYASDASFYYLVPEAVVQPDSEEQIRQLFQLANQTKTPIVFRAGGTSLSGQSITDGILVDLSKFWNKIALQQNGDFVKVQPGITGGMVNAYLKKYKRKIGPDPSSIGAAMMGGILSNNASGMCCGVQFNSYHTTQFIRFMLTNGQQYNTENAQDYDRFEIENPVLVEVLRNIKTEIIKDDFLHQKIRNKYKTKNTVGYSLNSFLDFEKSLDIFAHLLIGGEGTLAFITEATLKTVPDYPFKSTGLIYFKDIFSACQTIVPLTKLGVMMAELMDRASLKAVENLEGMPEIVKSLPDSAAALLVEFQENSLEALENKEASFYNYFNTIEIIEKPKLTRDADEQAFYWKVRKGLLPAVGAIRQSGTTVITEDLAFPIDKLGHAIIDLQVLLKKYNYDNGIILGHAKDGNIHFIITQTFGLDLEVKRYSDFMNEVVSLVVEKYQGALKAEHGTGRNMAPFVETEWGTEAYQIMCKIKNAADPENILNPGVIINADAKAHLKNLKQMPTVEAEVDNCIECGFCEPKCPSKNLTSSPRRRIVTRRILENLRLSNNKSEYKQLLKEFEYDGLQTCAVDGLCATACPVGINTGDLVKNLRVEQHADTGNFMASAIANNFALTQKTVRFALKTGFLINSVWGRSR